MHSVAERDDIEAALASAVRRFDGASPVTEQLQHHFGYLDSGNVCHPRLRMQLVIEVASAEGGSPHEALDVGAAVEILHNYALVHSDIEDAEAVRERRATVWQQYGIAHGINAGDALCAIAYLEVLTGSERRPPERTLVMTHLLQEANYAMCAGRAADIAFDGADRVSLSAYRAMMESKTGALCGVACQLGALEAGVEEARAAAYARLGRAYGVAAQILDDAKLPSKRRWTYVSVARTNDADDAQTAAIAEIAAGDHAATEADIDRNGRVRALLARSIAPLT